MTTPPSSPHTRLTVDLEAVAFNLASLTRLLESGVRTAGVVKADAYGHGLVPVARRLKEAGAEFLAVANLAEARLLRLAGVEGPILVLMGMEPDEVKDMVKLDLVPVLDRVDSFEALSQAALAGGTKATCQLKVDTGMARLGVEPAAALDLLERVSRLGGLEVTGLVSHLANGDEPGDAYSQKQADAYAGLLARARDRGHRLPDSSLCGSGGVICPPRMPPGSQGLVRLGISLYGGLPSPALAGRVELRTAMELTSRVLAVRPVKAGSKVSYGATWETLGDTWLGVVPVGYADGYPRAGSNRASVLIGGRRVPVRGRICMNMFMVELSVMDTMPGPGDKVVLLGCHERACVTVDEVADWTRTIPYEVTCSLGAAHKKHYR